MPDTGFCSGEIKVNQIDPEYLKIKEKTINILNNVQKKQSEQIQERIKNKEQKLQHQIETMNQTDDPQNFMK